MEHTDSINDNLTTKKIIILGHPNTGKSNLFNVLTGDYSIVANYPLTTVEAQKATCTIQGQRFEVFDTPGLHSLYIHSEEELAIRDMLFTEKPDLLIQCIDANQIKQSLTLTADLLELDLPLIIVLTAVTEAKRKGMLVNIDSMAQTLDTPVIRFTSIKDRQIDKLSKAIIEAPKSKTCLTYGEAIENAINEIETSLPETTLGKRSISILLLEDDQTVEPLLTAHAPTVDSRKITTLRDSLSHTINASISRTIAKKQNQWVDYIFSTVVSQRDQKGSKILKQFAQACRHPIVGPPILIFFIALTYFAVVHVAGFVEGTISKTIVDPLVAQISHWLTIPWIEAFLVGDYGILTLGLFNAFCTVLPILSIFFLMFGMLEDIGYIPNLCVLTNRLFSKIGITGKSIMPLVLGFGCKTMATLTTRGLSSWKEKYIAIYLIAFAIPCSAQLGLNMAILGKTGIGAFIIAFSALILVEILAGALLNKLIKDDGQSDFIQELPPIRIPNLKAIVTKTYYRLLWFLKEAVPIFVIAAVVLFFLDKSGGLGILKSALHPIITNWLGLPIDMVDALILTMARHEAAAGLILKMVNAGDLTYIQSIVAVVITTMFVPCFANIVAMCKEVGLKTGLIMTLIINVSSFVLAGLLNWLLIALL